MVLLGDFVVVKVAHDTAEVRKVGRKGAVSLAQPQKLTISGSLAVGVVVGLLETIQQFIEVVEGDLSAVGFSCRALDSPADVSEVYLARVSVTAP